MQNSIRIRMKWTEIEQKRYDENCVDEDGKWQIYIQNRGTKDASIAEFLYIN